MVSMGIDDIRFYDSAERVCCGWYPAKTLLFSCSFSSHSTSSVFPAHAGVIPCFIMLFTLGLTTAQFSASFNSARTSFFRLLDFPAAMPPFRLRFLASSLLRIGPMFFSLFILSPVHFLCFSGYLYPIFSSFLHDKKDRISAILYANPRIRTGLQWHSFVC